MKKLFLLITLIISLHSGAQSVFGYWYGKANVKTKSSLASALKVAYEMLGVEVKNSNKKNHLAI